MKNIIKSICAAAFVLTFAACGSSNKAKSSDSTTTVKIDSTTKTSIDSTKKDTAKTDSLKGDTTKKM